MGGVRHLRLVDVDVRLSWDGARLASLAAHLYRDAGPGGPGPGPRVCLAHTDRGYAAAVDGRSMGVRPTLGEVFQDAEWAITDAALADLRHRYLLVHAAAVVLGSGALLAVGPHGSGKTSLAAALSRHGAALLSDEVAPVARGDGCVHPFPRDLILHAGTLQSLPGLPPSPGFKCFAGYRYLPPRAVATRVGRGPAPVKALLFPGRAGGRPVSLRSLGPAEASRRILGQCFDLEGLAGGAVEVVARLASRPAAELDFDDAGPASDAVARWWERDVGG